MSIIWHRHNVLEVWDWVRMGNKKEESSEGACRQSGQPKQRDKISVFIRGQCELQFWADGVLVDLCLEMEI